MSRKPRSPIHAAEQLEPRRLMAAGDLDRTFGNEGIAAVPLHPTSGSAAAAVAANADGSLFVAATSYGRFSLGKLTEDGDFDTTFGAAGRFIYDINGGAPNQVDDLHGMVVQPDGKVVLAGTSGANIALVRANANGTLDTTFGTGGFITLDVVRNDYPYDLQLQPDGKLLAIGSTDNGNRSLAMMARFLPNGMPDPDFGNGGRVVSDLGPMLGLGVSAYSELTSAVVLPDGKIMAAGSIAPGRTMLVRYESNGALDPTFGTQGVRFDTTLPFRATRAITAAPGGGFYTVVGLAGSGLAKWTAAGAPDTTFGGGTGYVTLDTRNGRGTDGGSVVVQPDGNVLASSSTDQGWVVASFTPDGTQIFKSTQDFWTTEVNAAALALQPDGRAIVIGGPARYPSPLPVNDPLVARYRITPDPSPAARLEAGVIYVTGDDADNVLDVARDAVNWTVTLDGVVYTFPAAAASRVDARTLGGNDRVTFAPGAPAGNVQLGAGDDLLRDGGILRRGFGGDGADTFELTANTAGGPAALTRVKGDAGDDRLILLGTAGDDDFRVTHARVEGVGRAADHQTLERVVVRAGEGNDEVVLDVPYNPLCPPQAADGVPGTFEGEGGNDLFTVLRTPHLSLQSFLGGDGDDELRVAPSVDNRIEFTAGAGSADLVRFNGPDTGDAATIADANLSMSGTNVVLLDAPNLEAIELNGAGGGDTFTLARTQRGAPITINGGPGADAYATTASVPLLVSADVTFNAGGDAGDAATLADPGPAGPYEYLIGGGTVRRDGAASLRHTGLDVLAFTSAAGGSYIEIADAAGLSSLTAMGNSGNDVIEVAAANPFAGLGSDPGAKVRMSGGSAGDDTFRVTPDAAASFQVVGGSRDTLPPSTGNDPFPSNAFYDTADVADRLEVNAPAAGATGARLSVLGRGRGRYTFSPPHRLIDFAGIESLNDLPDPGSAAMGFSAGPPQQLTLAFAADVGASLSVNDLVLTNLNTNEPVPADKLALAYDDATRTARFTFPGFAHSTLPAGRYRAVLPAGSVVDSGPGGRVLAADLAVEFDPPPVASVEPVSPDPAATPTDAITIRFSEPVTGLTHSNLRLTRDNDTVNLINFSRPLTASPDGLSYVLSNLAGLTAPAGTYLFTVSASPSAVVDGNGVAMTTSASESWVMTQAATATSGRFDFGTATSALASGYSRVTHLTAYADAGYGWTLADPARTSRDRTGAVTSLTRDFVETVDGTFAANLADGVYDVAVTLGDAIAAHDQQRVSLEGVERETLDTAAGQFVTRTYRVTVTDGALTFRLQDGGAADPVAVVNALTITYVSAPPAQVVGVFVAGTGWTQAFRDHLESTGLGDADFGFAVDPAAPPDELPWTNLNQVSVRFSRAVDVAQTDLAAAGAAVGQYAVAGFAYDAQTFTATWTLDTAGVANEKLLLSLAGVTDAASGAALAGTTAVRLDVLPGDVNRSGGSVLGSDVTLVRNAQNATPGAPGSLYTIFKDVNGSGSILGSDVTLVRNRQGTSLPAGEPTAADSTLVAATSTGGGQRTDLTAAPFASLEPVRRALRLDELR